jgi:hypothetical protein
VTPRSRPWWHGVEAESESQAEPDTKPDTESRTLRDPWADHALRPAALTTAQEAVLAGLDDQPDGPRLDGLDPDGGAEDQPAVPRLRPGNGTGNAPGDPAPPDPHTRTRWTEQEEQEG